MMKAYLRKLFVVVLAVGMAQSMASVGHAQVMPNMMPMMMDNMMMMNNFLGAGGVIVDADGVLRTQLTPDPNGQLSRQRIAAARSALDPKLAKKSPLRKISLNRLETAVKSRTDMGMKPTEDMLNMAGMTRIQYVFFYPETNDIVLAGPAEAYGADLAGRVRGLDSGQATLNLDDLVVSLRAFFGEKGREAPLVSVSIDPTKEGLQQMQQFLNKMGSNSNVRPDAEFITKGLKESLGLQTVRLTGVPASSHFSQVLVEADYRMKLIGIGLEAPPANVKMASWAARANVNSISRNALQRWYFVPDYQCVRVAEDELAMELVGDGVKLVSADELVNADGTRAKAGNVDLASKGFTTDFTKNYAGIAKGIPVYWQLRNGIDMLVAAAFIKEHKYADKAGWKMETFLNEKEYAVETLNVPKQVETAVAAFWKGNRLATPIGGGVHIEPHEALKSSNLLDDKGGKVKAKRDEINLNALAKDQWWWD